MVKHKEDMVGSVKHEEDLEWIQALELVDKLVVRVTGKNLSEAQRIVLRCAWEQKEYKAISNARYSEKYLQHTIAPALWELLSSIFARRIVKRDVRSYLAKSNLANHKHLFQHLKILGGHLPDTNNFYGRKEDLVKLENEVLQQRLTILVGDTGIGKSLLAAKMLEAISREPAKKFDILLWKPIVYNISVEELVKDLLEILNLEINSALNLYQKISYLINQLRKEKCLIVLDGFETILSDSKNRQEYIKFFRRLLEEGYGTSFLLTTRVSFKELQTFSSRCLIKHIKICGLDNNSAIDILKDKGVKSPEQAKELVQAYRGNPSSIEELGEKISHYFGGNIQKYLKYKTTIIGERLQIMLHQFFGQPGLLNSLQRSIMIYLARELSAKGKNLPSELDPSIQITTILDFFKEQTNFTVSNQDLFSALKDLEGKLLIETVEDDSYEICYKLQPGVKKYILNDPLGLVQNNSDLKTLNM